MSSLFSANHFTFPYHYKFQGQSSDERILYVTRESEIMHQVRLLSVVITSAFIFLVGVAASVAFGMFLSKSLAFLVQILMSGFAILYLFLGWWWITSMWKKSLALITTRRLIKFIYTSPWNRHSFSLPLDMIVDTGAYSKGWLQALLKVGTFTARSSASSSGVATDDPSRVNKKYFYIENVRNFEDINHYLQKVLFVFRQDYTKLDTFRPFLPDLKGNARKEFMKQYPEYWS